MLFLFSFVEKGGEDGETSILLGCGFSCEFRESAKHVVKSAEVIALCVYFDLVRPASKEGGANASFIHKAFVAS